MMIGPRKYGYSVTLLRGCFGRYSSRTLLLRSSISSRSCFPPPLVLALVVVDRVRDALQQLADRLERDVQLVAITGQPFYGTRNLMNATGAKQAERIAVGRLSRRVQLNPGFRDADMGWAQALADMEEAR